MPDESTAVQVAQVPTQSEIRAAIQRGMQEYTSARPSGCGRVYVCLSSYRDGDKASNRKRTAKLRLSVIAVAKELNMIYQTKGYGVSNALKIGYDNCTGKELGQGTAVAEQLKALGIPCYRDEVGD